MAPPGGFGSIYFAHSLSAEKFERSSTTTIKTEDRKESNKKFVIKPEQPGLHCSAKQNDNENVRFPEADSKDKRSEDELK
jgi:hypothetical protein